MFEKTFFVVLNNVTMIEWDGLKKLRQLYDGQGDPIETYGSSR